MTTQPNDTTKTTVTFPTIDTEKVKAALEDFGRAAQVAVLTLRVQGAMGAVWTGEYDRAREVLSSLPRESLIEVRQAALTLAAMAEASTDDDTEDGGTA